VGYRSLEGVLNGNNLEEFWGLGMLEAILGSMKG
jgi:hypothetical protein